MLAPPNQRFGRPEIPRAARQNYRMDRRRSRDSLRPLRTINEIAMNETTPLRYRATHDRPETERNRVLTLTLRAVGYKALSQQGDPFAVCQAIAAAVNEARIAVELKNGMRKRAAATSASERTG
jgi:hypothetical protein